MSSNKQANALGTFIFHGLKGIKNEDKGQAVADCPLCGKEEKFYVNTKTGLWDCKSCKASGNPTSFVQQLWSLSDNLTEEYSELAKDRGILYPETLMHWGAARSVSTGEWLVPGYGVNGTVTQVYRYAKDRSSGKMRLLATTDLPHGIHGVNLYNKNKEDVYLLEGFWDATAFWEVLRMSKIGEQGLTYTGTAASSLAERANVLAVPGCNVFSPLWSYLFEGKRVFLMYDNDHEKPHPKSKQLIPGAAYLGMKRVAEILSRAEKPPSEIFFMKWGKGKAYFDASLPHGWDTRDALTKNNPTHKERIVLLDKHLAKLEPIPEDWIQGRSATAKKTGGTEIELLTCESWDDLVNDWKKALLWIDGMDRALSCMLACVVSTEFPGDQLWMKIIGPAACGKSTLCEALSTNKQHVVAKSTIRGFHSGFRSDASGETDNSLISQLFGKTLVTKDGDTLLQSPNLPQILAEARDVYDRTSRTHYRHGMSRDYEGVSMTWILCGTGSLRSIDSSELGERFLDCVIMEGIDTDLEDEILYRVAYRASNNMVAQTDGEPGDVELNMAMRKTGGYINFLKQKAPDLLHKVIISDKSLRRCIDLGKFVAYMRARPSARQRETAERESAARLVHQLVRLAKCLAIVLNMDEVNEEVLRRVRQVALDTARGSVLELVGKLYSVHNKGGISLAALAITSGVTDDKMQPFVTFLKKIGVLQNVPDPTNRSVIQAKWKLSSIMYNLYTKVYLNAGLQQTP